MRIAEQTDEALHQLDTGDVEALAVGVIGFDRTGAVRLYNTFESRAAGLARERVIGLHVFETVAPCMNNYLVAQRFEDAKQQGVTLDVTLDYVLTLRMKPTPVRLRLLSRPSSLLQFILVMR